MSSKRCIGPQLLYWSWVVHDMEELLAMRSTLRRLRARGYGWLPDLRQRDIAVAIIIMGRVMGYAASAGERTQGRSTVYRIAAAGYEAHAFTHLASAILTRQYTAGVGTVFPVILPAARIIRKEQRRIGHPLTWKDTLIAMSLFPPLALALHSGVHLLTSPKNRHTL